MGHGPWPLLPDPQCQNRCLHIEKFSKIIIRAIFSKKPVHPVDNDRIRTDLFRYLRSNRICHGSLYSFQNPHIARCPYNDFRFIPVLVYTLFRNQKTGRLLRLLNLCNGCNIYNQHVYFGTRSWRDCLWHFGAFSAERRHRSNDRSRRKRYHAAQFVFAFIPGSNAENQCR